MREAALAKGYHPSELGRLANAINYYMKATGASEEMAFEVVSTPGTRANLLMNCGGRFLKSAEAFAEGLETDDLPADMQGEPAADADPEVEAVRLAAMEIVKDPEAGPEANEEAKTVARDIMGLVDNVFDPVLDFALGIENPEPRPELLGKLEGKSLPPGWFVRVLADVKKLSVDELKNVRPGCGALRLHSVFSSFVDSMQSVIDGTDAAGGLQNERIYLVPIKTFVGTLMLSRCGQRNMQSLSEALHGADGGQLLQTYRDFESDDYVQYEMHGDDPVMTKMRMNVLATDRIKQLERFDILVATAAGQDMENYEMIDEEMFNLGVEHPGYSHDVVTAIGGDFEDIVRANPDAYSPQ